MMKKLVIVLAVLVLVSPSYAGIRTTVGEGALQMTLTYDGSGNATLTNTTGSSLSVDSYEIWSAGGNLDQTNWYSIQDAVAADFTGTTAALGSGVVTFGESSATALFLAEMNQPSSASFAAATPWSIGQPIDPGTSVGDLSFYYTPVGGVVGDKYLGVIVPEPATVALLALGGLVGLVRRRR